MKLAAKISGLVSRADGLTSQVIKTRKQVGGALADVFFSILFCFVLEETTCRCPVGIASHVTMVAWTDAWPYGAACAGERGMAGSSFL